MAEERDDTIVLTDESGEEHEFEMLDLLEVGSQRYALLIPLEAEEEGEAVVLRMDTDPDDNDILVEIEDDEEWERVIEAWEQEQLTEDLEEDEDD